MIDIEKYKQKALQILSPIKPADKGTNAVNNFLFSAKRSDASRLLPEYYLIFFLFSDLLNFKNLGRFEKIAWSFPIDYKGKAFLIEHRKFGVGVFIQDEEDQEIAKEIAKKISGAVKSIRPYYDYIAEQAVQNSEFNVVNNNRQLFERFDFLLNSYKVEYQKFLDNKGKTEKKVEKSEFGEFTTVTSLDFEFKQRANWLAISCIEAFYSWTEHLFIHLAIIGQGLSDGEKVSELIGAEWKTKFKAAIPLSSSKEADSFYNELITIRNQLRNFVAHGAFGKDGNAFRFHSKTGTVPVLMNHKKKKNKFSLHGFLTFKEKEVIELIEEFIKFLWSGTTAPAMEYTQEYQLPTILTLSANGTYAVACENMDNMKEFADELMNEFDDAANMDW
ncbi:hypothetical protein [Aquimarina sediminis]|uniref:hypothetical protein n=1 Tax=Aquimarina sediminis TaxID=2070536 RepID=UPI000CA00C65|nr:hypothetical protein [Aquimarina sediminis]